MKDEHPVQWVLNQLANDGIFTPLQEWVAGLMTGAMVPSETKMPDF